LPSGINYPATRFPVMRLRCGARWLDLHQPVVMGVLNVTPDSFSDGGAYFDPGRALERGLAMVEEGAAILDVGGESTRPGADNVGVDEELRRVIPVIERLAREVDVPISVDTSKPSVMRAAVAAGATLINDVNALRADGALDAAAATDAGVCLMHMLGEPRTMQVDPHYDDVVADVTGFLAARLRACLECGIEAERLAIDPGIGFGKRLEHNLALLASLEIIAALGRPVLVGVSRKSLLGALTGRSTSDRLYGGLALAALAVHGGASIVRTHDVASTVDAVRVAAALRVAKFGEGQRE